MGKRTKKYHAPNTIEIVGYFHWASFLVNGERGDLTDAELADIAAWGKQNDVWPMDVLAVHHETFFGRPEFDGALPGDCVAYIFARR